MTDKQLDIANKIKTKIYELNELISELNKDKDSRIKVEITQQNWNPLVNEQSVKNAIKYIVCEISEKFSY